MTQPTIPTTLTNRLRTAHTHMTRHGWTQGQERDDTGCTCLTGAIRYCAPQTGDEHVIRVVLQHLNRGENWNDHDDRTQDEVLGVLATADITDEQLAVVFGPNWQPVITLVRQAATITPEQAHTLYRAHRDDTNRAAREAAEDTTRNVARNLIDPYSATTTVCDAVNDTERNPAWTADRIQAAADAVTAEFEDVEPYKVLPQLRVSTRCAAEDAALAESVRHLITAEVYRALTRVWRTVFPDPRATATPEPTTAAAG